MVEAGQQFDVALQPGEVGLDRPAEQDAQRLLLGTFGEPEEEFEVLGEAAEAAVGAAADADVAGLGEHRPAAVVAPGQGERFGDQRFRCQAAVGEGLEPVLHVRGGDHRHRPLARGQRLRGDGEVERLDVFGELLFECIWHRWQRLGGLTYRHHGG